MHMEHGCTYLYIAHRVPAGNEDIAKPACPRYNAHHAHLYAFTCCCETGRDAGLIIATLPVTMHPFLILLGPAERTSLKRDN